MSSTDKERLSDSGTSLATLLRPMLRMAGGSVELQLSLSRELPESQCKKGSLVKLLPHCDPEEQGALGIGLQAGNGKAFQDSRMPNWALICEVANSFGNR